MDKTVIVSDNRAIEIQDRTVSGWAEPQSTWKVSQISNMFDILPIHHDKAGNYNRT